MWDRQINTPYLYQVCLCFQIILFLFLKNQKFAPTGWLWTFLKVLLSGILLKTCCPFLYFFFVFFSFHLLFAWTPKSDEYSCHPISFNIYIYIYMYNVLLITTLCRALFSERNSKEKRSGGDINVIKSKG